MATMAQSAANWHNIHSRGSHAFTHTSYINTATTTLCEAPAQLLQILESIVLFWRNLRDGGANRSTRRKPQTAGPLIVITYLEEKIQRPGRESNPHPPTLVHDKLAWPRARAASHPLSYRPPGPSADERRWREGGKEQKIKKGRETYIVW